MEVNSGSYVWGLDGSPGTIITDYVVGGLCSVYGLCILNLYKKTDTRPRDERERKVAKKAEHENRVKGRHPLLLVLALTFFICAAMNAIGALIHHFVPLVEPATLPVDVSEAEDGSLDFFSRMRLRLYPWYLVWQLANTSAVLYGIFMFLSAIYTIEFDVCLKDAAFALAGMDTVNEDENKTHGEEKKGSFFQSTKKLILRLILVMFLSHFAFRFWRIFEYRRGIFSSVFEDELELDVDEVKMDLERFGTIWSATAASIVMITAYLLNASIFTYLMIKPTEQAKKSTVREFKFRFVRTIGAWMLSFGGFVQLFYAGSCGRNSATECPFHISFNHNAWFHVLQGAGMTLWFLAEWTYFRKISRRFLEKKNL